MRTVAIVTQKGGAGKTTLTLHLAVAAVAAGHNTAIIDLDPQASSAEWGDRREADLPVVISAHSSRLPQEMERIRSNGGDLLLVDTAPHADSVALAATRAADLVLVPFRPNILDLKALMNTVDLIKATGTPFFLVMNAVPPVGGDSDDAAAMLDELELPICPVRVTNRLGFVRSLTPGLTAQETEPGGKAAQEIEGVYAHMMGLVEATPESTPVVA